MPEGSIQTSADRISDLPDELLTRILSALPTKDAAVSTLTSKRFLPVFSLLTSLNFDDSPICHCEKRPYLVERSPGFMNFVDYVLKACKPEQLSRFRLCFSRSHSDKKPYLDYSYHICHAEQCYPDIEPTRLNAWITFSLTRSVRELDLCINVKKSTGCRELPRSIFLCETLEMLKLDSNLDLDVYDVNAFPISLPRLKLLHLRTILFTEDEFVTKLVKSCPLLEDLLLECWWKWGDVLVISSPSLLKLVFSVDKCKKYTTTTHVTIETPNLRSFRYHQDNLAEHYSIPNMTALVQADICIQQGDGRWLRNFLNSFSTVSHLSLLGKYMLMLDDVDLKNCIPVFHNLNHLEFSCRTWSSWYKALVQILECCPSLKTLVFPEGLGDPTKPGISIGETKGYEQEREFWRTTQGIPSCCKFSLRNIVIKRHSGLPRELLLVRSLLEKALVLESLVISLSKEVAAADSYNVWLLNSLQKTPRASTLCSIMVS